MKTIQVNPKELRRVGRMFASESNLGLSKLSPIDNAILYIHYDPRNKLYFSGSIKHIYPYFYTNDEEAIIEFISKQLTEVFPNKFIQVQAVEVVNA